MDAREEPARPFIRVLASVLVASGCLSGFIGWRQFWVKRDLWDAIVVYSGALMIYLNGSVVLTGKLPFNWPRCRSR
jgi:hypothetical protein